MCIFLSARETNNFLFKDADNYVKNFTPVDVRARNAFNPYQYIDIIKNAGDDYSSYEKSKLKELCSIIDHNLIHNILNHYHFPVNIQKLINIPWIFAKTTNVYEMGMPHTRLNIIFLNDINIPAISLLKILIHEKIHVYQRKYISEIEDSLKNIGYKKIGKAYHTDLIRSNPDITPDIYADNNNQAMYLEYTSPYPRNILDLKSDDYANEHPFELMAYSWENIVNQFV